MRPISNVDTDVLETALDVIEGHTEEGTEHIYVVQKKYVEEDENGAIRYDSEIDIGKVNPGEDVPRTRLLWARTKSEIEDELERR